MYLVIQLALGLAVGWLVSRYLPERPAGLLGDLALGGLGACVAGFLAGPLLPGGAGLVIALLGAAALIAAVRLMTEAGRLAARLRFWRPETVGPLTEPMRRLLGAERGLGEREAESLRMKMGRGLYAGRTVTYFQV